MDEDDFIKEIVQNPHDETLRLVFADFLEDQGDPRAEMIRLQFQRQEMSRFDSARDRIRARELKLLRAHGGFGRTPPNIKAMTRHGGFIDGIECTKTRFLKNQKEIFQSAPIRYVQLKGQSAKFDSLNDSPYLGRIAGLTLKGTEATTEQLCRLVSNPGFTELKSLDIRVSAGLEFNANALLRSLCSAPALGKLESLSVSNYFAIGDRISELVNAPFRLKELSLGLSGDAQLEFISGSDTFARLTSLDVAGDFSADGIRQLQTGAYGRELECVVLRNNGDYFVQELGAADTLDASAFDVTNGLPKLRHLQTGYRLGDAFVEPLCRSYPGLEVLDLAANQLTNASAAVLAGSPVLKSLRQLRLTQNQIGVKGVRMLADSPHRHKKLKLYLQGNNLAPREVKKIRKDYGNTFGNLAKPWSMFGR